VTGIAFVIQFLSWLIAHKEQNSSWENIDAIYSGNVQKYHCSNP